MQFKIVKRLHRISMTHIANNSRKRTTLLKFQQNQIWLHTLMMRDSSIVLKKKNKKKKKKNIEQQNIA